MENKKVNIRSIIFTCMFFSIFALDLLYKFGNYDTPFIIVGLLSAFLIYTHSINSRYLFIWTFLLLVTMGYDFVRFGTERITERTGEWFYVFFALGLVAYFLEIRRTIE